MTNAEEILSWVDKSALTELVATLSAWMSSISATNGALAANASTMLSIRSTRNKVTPAPSAPGIACTANVATASNSVNPRLPATRPARSPMAACKSGEVRAGLFGGQ